MTFVSCFSLLLFSKGILAPRNWRGGQSLACGKLGSTFCTWHANWGSGLVMAVSKLETGILQMHANQCFFVPQVEPAWCHRWVSPAPLGALWCHKFGKLGVGGGAVLCQKWANMATGGGHFGPTGGQFLFSGLCYHPETLVVLTAQWNNL